MESNEYYAVATLLDPRFKQRMCSSSTSVAPAKQMLTVAYKRFEDQEEESATNVTKHARLDQNDSSSTTAKKWSSLLWKFCENSESDTSPLSTQSEYLKEPAQPSKSYSLYYWKGKQDS